MATNFPTSLDSLTNPATSDQLSSPSHASQHANANDAIEQLEAKVGANGSAVTTSHDYKIAQLEAAASDVQNSLGDYIPLSVLGQPSGPAELNPDGNLIVPENKIIIEGATADAFELTIQAPDVTSDITVTLPNVSGTLATTADVSTAVTNLVASAPATLDTLNELATALGNDANFATTTATSIGNKVSKAGGDVIQSSLSSVIPLVLKGAASQTANLQEWQDSAGNLLGRITSTGVTSFYGGSNIFPGDVRAGTSSYLTAALSVASRVATESGLVVRGFASQSANLQEWQNSTGTSLAWFTSNGTLNVRYARATTNDSTVVPLIAKGAASQTAKLQEWQNSAGTVVASTSVEGNGYFQANLNAASIGAGNNIGGASLTASPWSAVTTVSIIRGYTSQTADLTQWQNSSGAVLTKIDSSGAIYLINPNPSANAGAITSPSINFQGSIWNNAYGSQTIKGAINVTESLGNTNPTISKMSFLLATDNGTPAEVASFTNTGAFSNIGGLDAYGSSVIFRLRNTTDATTLAHTPSPKLELMGRAWNSSQGSAPTRAYLQVNANSINSDPFINRLGFFVATGNNAGGWVYGADATEYMSILGNGTVGINSTTPLATLDVRPTSVSNKGILIRGISGQTANLTEWQDTSGTVYAFINPYGQLSIGQSPTIYSNARISINTVTTTVVGQVIRGVASQTANLQEWQNSAGSVLASIASNGGVQAGTYNGVVIGLNYPGIVIDTSVADNTQVWLRNLSASTKSGRFVGIKARPFYADVVSGDDLVTLVGQQYISNLSYDSGKIVISNDDSTPSPTSNPSRITFHTTAINSMTLTERMRISNSGNVLINGFTAATVGLTVKGAASQTANLQEWQNSAGAALASISSSGAMGVGDRLTVYNGVSAYNASSFGSPNVLLPFMYDSMVNISTSYATSPGLVIRGVTSQTADLQQWRSIAGTVLAKVDASGNFTATSKSFDIAHPTKENMRLRYGSLEGPENGVYVRGTVESNIIELPDYWTGLVHADSITVSLTSVGSAQNIYVEKIENNNIYIGGNLEKAFFTVYGERKDIDNLTVEY